MIKEIEIQAAQKHIPWQKYDMVEQDLIISRALVSLFSHDTIRQYLIFRGGTALNKLYLKPPARYSEDLDLVVTQKTKIGFLIDAIRECLAWLGTPKTSRDHRGFKLFFPFENVEGGKSKLKIEINGTEIFRVDELKHIDFQLESEWFSGSTSIITYSLEELMGTKLRALYQRRKGRDLFDAWFVFSRKWTAIDRAVEIFHQYNTYNRVKITQEMFIESMEKKRENIDFRKDMDPMLPPSIHWNFDVAYQYVMEQVVPLI